MYVSVSVCVCVCVCVIASGRGRGCGALRSDRGCGEVGGGGTYVIYDND